MSADVRGTRVRGSRVGVVGAGRVGAVLGAAFAAAGYPVVAASGFSQASRLRMARLLGGARCLSPDEVSRSSDVVIIAVGDDSLAPLVRGLAAVGAFRRDQVVVHTSGAHGRSVLEPAARAGARAFAMHPAMTFTGTAVDLDRLADGVSFGVSAPARLRPLATRLVADLGGSVEWIAEEHRVLYHAALAHGANHLVTLLNEAMDRLREAGVAQPQRVLAPLVRAAVENTLSLGDEALTGPVSRGDAGTVAKHVATLRSTAPSSADVYVALARRTADRAIASGRLTLSQAQALLVALAEAEQRSPMVAGQA